MCDDTHKDKCYVAALSCSLSVLLLHVSVLIYYLCSAMCVLLFFLSLLTLPVSQCFTVFVNDKWGDGDEMVLINK